MSEGYLVTGAPGYVGTYMVKLLVEKGDKVRAMVRSTSDTSELEKLGVETVVADLADKESLQKAVAGVRGIFHIASIFRQANIPESIFHDINIEGTRRLFEAAIEQNVERIVHCSTVGVLGHIKNPPANEETEFGPGDKYQRTKLGGEKMARKFFKKGKMKGVVVRPAMIWGPGDTRNLKLFKMIKKEIFFYVGPGDGKIHLVDVRDVVNCFYLAMNKPDINNEVYIVAGEGPVVLRDLANLIADKLQVKRPWIRLPIKPMQWLGTICECICIPFRIQPPIFRRRVDFYTKVRHFDWAKAARELDYKPAQPLEGEVDDMIASYQERGWL